MCSEDSETENTMDTNQSSGDEHISDREQGEQEMDEGNQKDKRKAEGEENVEGQEEQAISPSDSNI